MCFVEAWNILFCREPYIYMKYISSFEFMYTFQAGRSHFILAHGYRGIDCAHLFFSGERCSPLSSNVWGTSRLSLVACSARLVAHGYWTALSMWRIQPSESKAVVSMHNMPPHTCSIVPADSLQVQGATVFFQLKNES